MKKIITLIGCTSLAFTLAACNNVETNLESKASTNEIKNNVNQTAEPKSDDNIVATIETTADIIEDFETVDKLVNGAEIIVQGVVEETNSYVLEPGVVTEYKFKVTNSLQGEFQNGNVIDMISAGGIVSYTEFEKLNPVEKDFEEKLTDEQKKKGKIKYMFAGTPLIEAGQEYVIFASKYPVDGKTMYGAVGVYQGQYKVEGDNVTRHDPGSEEKGKIKKVKKDKFIKEVKDKSKTRSNN